jgi:FtsZ-binding cell division protein ZapB
MDNVTVRLQANKIEELQLRVEELEEENEQLKYEKRELKIALKECEQRCNYDNYNLGFGDDFLEDI